MCLQERKRQTEKVATDCDTSLSLSCATAGSCSSDRATNKKKTKNTLQQHFLASCLSVCIIGRLLLTQGLTLQRSHNSKSNVLLLASKSSIIFKPINITTTHFLKCHVWPK